MDLRVTIRVRVLLLACVFGVTLASFGQASNGSETLQIDAGAATTPFPHFWEQTFGSGRAILSLRESYRQDLRTVKEATNFKSIRFHGILTDEVGLYDPDRMTKNPGLAAQKANDASRYNFSYIDQIYDGLLAMGVRPFAELSFTPGKMASDPKMVHPFWYHPNVSPPRYPEWDGMIAALARHLVERYGIDEVATWKFEVWNEPNLDFWGGSPKQATYFELYDHTARALKEVSPRLQVGGPSTAQAAWVTPFLEHARSTGVPVDFVSTHVYGNDPVGPVLGEGVAQPPRDQMVARAVKKVHEEILRSAYPKVPLIFSEYNASYANEPDVTDSTYMGPWMANNIRLCDGLTESMSYWAFSDVFEEQGVVRSPFYGGFGLVAADHIPKASLNVFRALHELGDRRLAAASESVLATTGGRGKVAVALWDYTPPDGEGASYTPPPANPGPAKVFRLQMAHVAADAPVEILRVDADHGNAEKAFNAMGRPPGDLTQAQVKQLQAAGEMAAPERTHLQGGKLEITVPPHGLAVVLVGQ